jgi:hypothetical protein
MEVAILDPVPFLVGSPERETQRVNHSRLACFILAYQSSETRLQSHLKAVGALTEAPEVLDPYFGEVHLCLSSDFSQYVPSGTTTHRNAWHP